MDGAGGYDGSGVTDEESEEEEDRDRKREVK